MSVQNAVRLLLIETTGGRVDTLAAAFPDETLEIEHVTSVEAARALLQSRDFSAVLLEGSLAGPEGFSFIREIDAPVLLASLPANYELIMSAYVAGAADFICGAASDIELAARLRYLLERRHDTAARRRYRIGPYELDVELRHWGLDGTGTHLTHHETQFLAALAESPKHFCTYADLITRVWGSPTAVETQNLRVLAGHVRKKIALASQQPDLLRTVTGVGYKLSLDDQ
ncbi:MAG TPA: response regulator transcription factor [Allosphingosinicella sp.]|uniref:response regulator transcription factor n=1 Tax=Allosphingosinicella sp. TaxID=2823234 RepID=UPI002ED9B70F